MSAPANRARALQRATKASADSKSGEILQNYLLSSAIRKRSHCCLFGSALLNFSLVGICNDIGRINLRETSEKALLTNLYYFFIVNI